MAEGPEPPALGGARREQRCWSTVPIVDPWWGAPGAPAPTWPRRLLFVGVRLGYGGTQSGVMNIIRHLDPREFSVRILAGNGAEGAEQFESVGAEVFHLPELRGEGLSRALSHRENVTRFVNRHVWSWRPHLIFAWSWDLAALERTGIPVVTRVRALGGIMPEEVPAGVFCYRVSHACPGDWPVIEPGVEVVGPPDDGKRVPGHVVRIGRADPDRHPEVFADALTLMGEDFDEGMTVTLIGEPFYGSWDWAAELEARGLTERVRFLGHLPHEDAMAVLETAAVHVANAPETFGQATAEAMMRGVIPVVCDQGYGPDMVWQHGVVVENTPEAVRDGIREALQRSGSIFNRAAVRRHAIDRYDSRRSAEINAELFRKLTEFPLVDIILPCRNHRAMTQDCIESILGNTRYANWRLYVVDDASEDDTWDYLQKLAEYEPRVRIYRNAESKGGIASAMDLVDISYGQYVMLMNNDMLVPPGWLGLLLSGMAANPHLGLLTPVLSDEEKPEARLRQGIVEEIGARSVGLWLREALQKPDEDLAALQSCADNTMVAKMLAAGWKQARHFGVELFHVGSLTRIEIPYEQIAEGRRIWLERYQDPVDAEGNPVQIGRPAEAVATE